MSRTFKLAELYEMPDEQIIECFERGLVETFVPQMGRVFSVIQARLVHLKALAVRTDAVVEGMPPAIDCRAP